MLSQTSISIVGFSPTLETETGLCHHGLPVGAFAGLFYPPSPEFDDKFCLHPGPSMALEEREGDNISKLLEVPHQLLGGVLMT